MASKTTLRVRRIRDKVSLLSLFPKLTGTRLISIFELEQQVRCPFHGKDNKPSARIYPDSDRFYCYVCKESLDAFSFFTKHVGLDFEDWDKTDELLRELEDEYDLHQYNLEDYRKDSDIEPEKVNEDYKPIFMNFWFELNDTVCESLIEDKEVVYKALDTAWDQATTKNNYKEVWDFLHKLEDKYRSDL